MIFFCCFKKIFQWYFKEIPEVPDLQISLAKPDSVTLSWNSMAYADGPRIFILNINDMYNETIQATDDSTEEHSITVNGLFPDYKYTKIKYSKYNQSPKNLIFSY